MPSRNSAALTLPLRRETDALEGNKNARPNVCIIPPEHDSVPLCTACPRSARRWSPNDRSFIRISLVKRRRGTSS